MTYPSSVRPVLLRAVTLLLLTFAVFVFRAS